MAAVLAGLALDGGVRVDTAEAAGVTLPNFAELMRSLGAKLQVV